MSVNKVILVGHLGKDPELRGGGTERSWCTFDLATNHRFKRPDGEWAERTNWHHVVVNGAQAEACGKHLSKGRQVYVEGRIDIVKRGEEGQERYFTNIVARDVRFMSPGRSSAQGGPTPF